MGLEHGLRLAVEQQLDEFARVHGIACSCDTNSAGPSTASDAEAALFRIMQEALANIARHASATQVHVALNQGDGLLTLTVSDNGVGLPVHPSTTRGRGLDGMRQRVAAAGGQFAIDSTRGSGTRLALSFPLPLSPAAD